MSRVVTCAVCCLLLPGPALGWSFTPDPICTLSHQGESLAVTVTHDPVPGEYAIVLTLAAGTWPESPAFHIAFRGGRELTIGTGVHALADGGRRLTVRDTGFGNVLDGLEFNAAALAWAGERQAAFSLAGAAGPVRAFRACAQTLGLS